jgi:hypothetical protein
MGDFSVNFKVFKDVLAIYVIDPRIVESPLFSQIETKIGMRIKSINVDPTGFGIRPAAEIEFQVRALQEGLGPPVVGGENTPPVRDVY